jgi:2-polyprenyl-6-methoxyphenol hydroxylase-like FAD-dependent oxidoreductase
LLTGKKVLKQKSFDTHHALVIGGSMAGLLAARVLSEHFERVTILERDHLIDDAQPRKGVPQGRHVHGLLAGGRNSNFTSQARSVMAAPRTN